MAKQFQLLTGLFVLFSTLFSPLASVLPARAAVSDAPRDAAVGAPAVVDDFQQADLPYFPETGYRLANPKFADYFAKRGGLRTFGYPVSRGFKFLGTDVQFFQRQIMQLRPDGAVGTLNILDADLMPYTRINGSVFPASSPAVIGSDMRGAIGSALSTGYLFHVRSMPCPRSLSPATSPVVFALWEVRVRARSSDPKPPLPEDAPAGRRRAQQSHSSRSHVRVK